MIPWQSLLKILNHLTQVFHLKLGVQDIIEAMAKRKYYDEELKKINLEGEKITMELNEMLFAKMHVEEVHGV